MPDQTKSLRTNELDGFDPLGEDALDETGLSQVFQDASRRVVHNILKSYTGYFDVFSELLQNSLDAVQQKHRNNQEFQPKLWLDIDIQNSRIRLVDNGGGMSAHTFKYCLRPNVSFKTGEKLRGQKGVGATFLAYGFSFIRVQSKTPTSELAATLRQGRQWAEDASGTIPRPKLQALEYSVPELVHESSGTAIEIICGKSAGERPSDLGWMGAQTAEQWLGPVGKRHVTRFADSVG